MFTIRKKAKNKRCINGKPPIIGRFFILCLLFITVGRFGVYAQCGFRENGYLFLHPYFDNVNWQAVVYQSVIFPSEVLCSNKPSRISWSRSAERGWAVYTDTAGAWAVIKAPLVSNNCVCCRPTIEFEEPITINVDPALSLQPSLPFHLLNRGAVDNDSLYISAAGSGSRIYCLHVEAGSGRVGAVDTVIINRTGQQTISGVWGEADAAGFDTAIWVGGSAGLLRLIPFRNNKWGTAREFTFDNSETVSDAGGGYIGTASGKIYRRSSLAAFTLDNSLASAPIRHIGKRIAVGDNGSLLINVGNAWRRYSSGLTNYLYGNLTSSSGGTSVELIDSKGNYSLRTLFDSSTAISAVTPSEVSASLNGTPYSFEDRTGLLTVTIRLKDFDDNREIPAVVLKRGASEFPINKAADGAELLRQDPAAVCSTANVFFNDSLIKLILSPGEITLEANAGRGFFDAACGFWKRQSFVFRAKESWKINDTLIMRLGKDTLKIINNTGSTVTARFLSADPTTAVIPFFIQRKSRSVRFSMLDKTEIRKIAVIDASGRAVWERSVSGQGTETIISPPLSSGIHLIIIDYSKGTSEIRRMVIPGR